MVRLIVLDQAQIQVRVSWLSHCFKRRWVLKILIGEKAPANKTQVPTESIIKCIWVVGTLNQLFIRGCHAEIRFSKK